MPIRCSHCGGRSRCGRVWWASFVEEGQAITLAGATVLRFDSDGLVIDHVDYWMQSQGRAAPYPGSGQ
jgi:hypothetical protein